MQMKCKTEHQTLLKNEYKSTYLFNTRLLALKMRNTKIQICDKTELITLYLQRHTFRETVGYFSCYCVHNVHRKAFYNVKESTEFIRPHLGISVNAEISHTCVRKEEKRVVSLRDFPEVQTVIDLFYFSLNFSGNQTP